MDSSHKLPIKININSPQMRIVGSLVPYVMYLDLNPPTENSHSLPQRSKY